MFDSAISCIAWLNLQELWRVNCLRAALTIRLRRFGQELNSRNKERGYVDNNIQECLRTASQNTAGIAPL
jgi:hypothetical protein